MAPIDTDEALAEMKAGRIDAMFIVAGYPVKLLSGGEDETAVGTPAQGGAPGAEAAAPGPGERRARASGFVERRAR